MTADKSTTPIEEAQRKIQSVKRMKEIMTSYYIEAKTAKENNRKVAWITSGGPVEPLIAMDVIPVYPENHGAMIGASKMGIDLCEKAEQMGYARDLCSYARADIACATVDGGPIGGLPRPDFLVCCNNICGTVLKWYEVQARYFDVPLFIFDTPFIHTEFSAEAQKYVHRQFEEFFVFLEEQCGRTFDRDRFEETARFAYEALHLWQEVLDMTTRRPAPMTAFDAFTHLALIVTLRGTSTAVEYYTQLRDEMRERVVQGIGMVPREEHRLLWDNLPIWYRMRWLSETFAGYNASLVADTYSSAWSGMGDHFDENDLVGALAASYANIYINISIDRMFESLRKKIVKYEIDGLVMHSNRSCKPYSFGQYDLQKRVMDELGVPTLMIEADMVDERAFSEAQVDTRIEAFIETLRQKKEF